jgi:AraC family transcriptional regulator of adaptative response / DNA-3-methyladenine glycosylase II
MGARQLRRLFQEHLGASPIAVAQTRRVLFAKQLIHDTPLSMAEVAMAAGFGSLRRFNDAFRILYHRPPSELRGRKTRPGPQASAVAPVVLYLSYRPPYDWGAMLAYLRARTIDGVEFVENGVYRRTVSHEGGQGNVAVAHAPDRHALMATIHFPYVRALQGFVTRVRHLFDVGADVNTISSHLAKDQVLAPLIAALPGLRTPGCWDGFELAVRAVLGQHISVEAARQLGNKLVHLCGDPVGHAADPRLAQAFPSAHSVATADLSRIRMPESRRATLKALAQAAVANPRLFEPPGSVEESITQLRTIRGIGPWTAQYIALRALRDPDAFPATDIGILRGAASLVGCVPTVSQLIQRAEAWRPWRAYAAQYLWLADTGTRHRSMEAHHAE